MTTHKSGSHGGHGKKATTTVKVTSAGFDPATLTVEAGETVEFTNGDTVPHTVNFNTGVTHDLAPGATCRQEFTDAGTFDYHCALHPHMTGTVTVS